MCYINCIDSERSDWRPNGSNSYSASPPHDWKSLKVTISGNTEKFGSPSSVGMGPECTSMRKGEVLSSRLIAIPLSFKPNQWVFHKGPTWHSRLEGADKYTSTETATAPHKLLEMMNLDWYRIAIKP